MINRTVESSPQFYARMAGALYLVSILLGIFAEVARDSLIVSGDAAATAANIMSRESLWRFGIASELVAGFFVTALAMIYFVLLKPVSKELNLLATFLRMVAIAVQTAGLVNLGAALFPLGNAAYVKAFTPEQLYALANLTIKTHSYGYGVALLFFGFTFLIHGYLIFRSGFLPWVLGIMIQVGGLCYLTNSFALILYPAVASRIFPIILLPSFIAETALCLWLLVKGVNVQKWKECAASQRSMALATPNNSLDRSGAQNSDG